MSESEGAGTAADEDLDGNGASWVEKRVWDVMRGLHLIMNSCSWRRATAAAVSEPGMGVVRLWDKVLKRKDMVG